MSPIDTGTSGFLLELYTHCIGNEAQHLRKAKVVRFCLFRSCYGPSLRLVSTDIRRQSCSKSSYDVDSSCPNESIVRLKCLQTRAIQ